MLLNPALSGKWWRPFGRRKVPELLQFEAAECGTCCMGMILAYFGRWESMDRLRDICGASRDGISAGSLARAAKQLNLNVKGFGVSAEQLAELPMPQIIFWNFNHFVVLESIHEDMVTIQDPAMGRRHLRFEDLQEGYSGVTLCLEPGEGFEASGQRPSVLKEVRNAARGAEGAIGIMALVGFSVAIMMTLIPSLSSIFIDYVLIKKGVDSWKIWFIVGIAAFGLTFGPVLWFQRAGVLKLQTWLAMSLATRIVRQLFTVNLEYFSRRFGGEIGGRVMLADAVAGTVSGALVGIISAGMQVLVLGLAMFSYSLYLTSIAFVLLFVYAWVSRWITQTTAVFNRRLAMERGRYESQVINSFSLIEHSRASGSSDAMAQRVLDRYVAVTNAEQANAPYAALLSSLPGAITGVLMALITGFSALEVIQGNFTIGVFVAYTAMASLLINPFTQIVGALAQISNAGGSFDRVNDLLRIESASTEVTHPRYPERFDLEIENLEFDYGSTPVLQGVSASIQAGSFVGIVGSVGSGKSTLLSLIARMQTPRAGTIRVGGVPLSDIDPSRFSEVICFVPQKDHMFEGSIMENLTLWDADITEEQVMEACKICCIHEDIMRRPGGYRSRLREGGSDLSGGQRQRLSLARAMVRKPQIMVLDEATSALDGEAEAMVLNNLRATSSTVIFATHRMATIRMAEQIIVVDRGHIRETGSHDELATAGGTYQRLLAATQGVTI